MYNNELYHYGVKGMKWGRRKARGHAGPGKYVTKKRQQAGDKRDLDALNKGQHLSVGFTKKRQAKFDARDKAAIEKRMAKNEAELNDKPEKKGLSDRQKTALKIGAAAVGTALVAYGAKKASDYIKSEAGRRSYEAGKKRIAEIDTTIKLIQNVKSDGFVVPNYEYAARLANERRSIPRVTNERTKKVSSSTKEAVKYLYSQRKRK